MKNYKESDYALNKYSEGIIYKFADGIVEITLIDYLRENPEKTEKDFAELKILSDKIYHEQVVQTNRTSRLDVTMSGLEESEHLAAVPLDTELIHRLEGKNALQAARQLLDSGELTEVQRRRFILHFFEGFSYRQIAKQEGVFFTSVAESVGAAARKLKKFFEKI